MTTQTSNGHAVYCGGCGDDLGECAWPGCTLPGEHSSHGLCTWCFQHGAPNNAKPEYCHDCKREHVFCDLCGPTHAGVHCDRF